MSSPFADAGGVICVSKGDYFKSVGTKYTYNEAQSVGGAVMIESVKLVDIQFDKYLNGTAAMSGMPSTKHLHSTHVWSV